MDPIRESGRHKSAFCSCAMVVLTVVVFLLHFSTRPERSAHGVHRFPDLPRTDAELLVVGTRRVWPDFPLTAEECRSATFAKATDGGRLGNMIAEYATVFSYARKHGKIPVLGERLREWLHPIFPHLSLRTEGETGCPPRNWIAAPTDELHGTVLPPWNETDFARGKDVFLVGYPSDARLFHEFRTEWMPDFRFNEELLRDVRSFFSSLSTEYGRDATFVGVHVRRTDQIILNRNLFGAGPVSAAYYRRAMAHFDRLFPNPVFVLTSDDMRWSKEHVNHARQRVAFVEGRGRDFDFALLSHCNHSIISVGTFGFFVAYFAGGIVAAPKVVSERPMFVDFAVARMGVDNWIFINNH